jgi:hypothetical protein
VLTTSTWTFVSTNIIIIGGNITSDGGASITARGVCWDINHNPTTVLSTKTSDGTGTGLFTSTLINLLKSTQYYIRAYATNSQGTSYGQEIMVRTAGSLYIMYP